jgi:hypothetical protein
MQAFFQFASDSPWLAFFVCLVISQLLYAILFRLPNRLLRHLNIRKAGWPPAHVDADGDFKSKEG